MGTVIAMVGRGIIQSAGQDLDEDIEGGRLSGLGAWIERNVDLSRFNRDDGSERSCVAVEAEHPILIGAAGLERSFSRLCGHRCDCSRLLSVLRVSVPCTIAFCGARFGDLGCC